MENPKNAAEKKKKKIWLVKCPGCKKDVTKSDAQQGDAVYVLGRVWHMKHLSCNMCKTALIVTGCRASPLDASTPICIDCYMETQHPSCYACHLPLRETCITAMKKKFHQECFRCCRCRGAMPNGEYFIWKGSPFDEDCYYTLRYVRRTSASIF